MNENPYVSPQTIEPRKEKPSEPKVSFLRGGIWAVIWGGVAFAIAPLVGAFARCTYLMDESEYRLSEILAQCRHLLGFGIFLGILFSLSAIANYTPAVRVGFIRTLLWILLAFLATSFLIVIASIPFEWPLSPTPHYYYKPTVAETLWIDSWFLSGTFLFTAYLVWRRIRMPNM